MLTSQTLIIVVILAMAFVIANLPKKQTNENLKDLHKTTGVSIQSSNRRRTLREFLRKSQQK